MERYGIFPGLNETLAAGGWVPLLVMVVPTISCDWVTALFESVPPENVPSNLRSDKRWYILKSQFVAFISSGISAGRSRDWP